MDIYLVLIKLLCAHLCADFIFQTDCINKGKRKQGIEGLKYLLLHSIIHAIAAYLFMADWTNIIIPLVIFSSHFAIDMIKSRYFKESLSTFFTDQFLHIAVIGALWFVMFGETATRKFLHRHTHRHCPIIRNILAWLMMVYTPRMWILLALPIVEIKSFTHTIFSPNNQSVLATI